MKKLTLGLLVWGLLIAETAWGNLTISPFYVQFDANSKNRSDVVRMTNSSAEKKTYRIKLVNFRQMPDGTYQEITEPIPGNPFASPYIAFSPRETTLEPRQSQTIRIQRKAMAAAKDGEYVSHLLMQEMPPKDFGKKTKSQETGGIKIELKALHGVTIPVIIDKGDLYDQGIIAQASLVRNAKNPYVEATIKRSGTRSFWGTLLVKDGNEEIGRINNFKIFLTAPQRTLKVPLSRNPSQRVQLILMDARTNAVISRKDI